MCGIAGVLNLRDAPPPTPREITRMIGMIRHRGPDAAGGYCDDRVGLGHARLSIVDPVGGQQPLTNERRTLWLVCNGEIFNYTELRCELVKRGHRFRTGSDNEVILHLYEDHGLDCLDALNGQFAFALWDADARRLVLARDRLGIRPLFYTIASGRLFFASEIKALLVNPDVPRRLDVHALADVFTSWSPLSPRTMFEEIVSLPAGHVLTVDGDRMETRRYWSLSFPPEGSPAPMSMADAADRLHGLLADATRLQVRADVPVAAYLSGGLDSAVVTALAQRHLGYPLHTFGVSFVAPEFDEAAHQRRVAEALGTQHHTLTCGPADIAGVMPELIWHTETPLVRTAPAPLFLLSELVRKMGFKVALTGEGADEFQVGYDIFREAKIRALWARQPKSRLHPLMLRRLYEHIPEMSQPSQAYLEAFFCAGLDRVDEPDFSHHVRWRNTARLHRYFAPAVHDALAATPTEDTKLLAGVDPCWDAVSKAQYVEAVTFLEPYLLSSQGDRVAMAHAVEGRVPFLDHRVVELSNALPSTMKLRTLHEKALLRKAAAGLVPGEIIQRPKFPFRAPIREAFALPGAPEYVAELLDPAHVAHDGLFKPEAVSWLLDRARSGARLSETDNMGLVGVISSALFRHQFWDGFDQRVRAGAASAEVLTGGDAEERACEWRVMYASS